MKMLNDLMEFADGVWEFVLDLIPLASLIFIFGLAVCLAYAKFGAL